MRRWLARLSFSMFVVAFALGWQAYQQDRALGCTPKVVAQYLGAALCVGVGLAGVRERHRPDNE